MEKLTEKQLKNCIVMNKVGRKTNDNKYIIVMLWMFCYFYLYSKGCVYKKSN